MWRSVFLHEFRDQRIDTFQAAPGQATPAPLALAPDSDPATGTTSIAVRPGVGFEYVLDTPLTEVVGVSCRVRMSYPIAQQQFSFAVIRVGGPAELLLKTSNPTSDQSGTIVSPAARIGGQFVPFKSVVLPASAFVDVRFDWHSSGQARLILNDRLVAYRNGVAAGQALTVDRVIFGMPELPASATPAFRISRVFVRVLPRVDPLRHFSTLLPPVTPLPDDAKRCVQDIMTNVLAIVDRLRAFMAQFHDATSQPWSQQEGPASGPFQPEARKAHDFAMKAMSELVSMLRTSDFSAPERFLDPFTEFLRALRDVLPKEFASLAAEIDQEDVVTKDCRELLSKYAEENRGALLEIGELLTQASERVREIAGGQ
jgi:hypothetical protein